MLCTQKLFFVCRDSYFQLVVVISCSCYYPQNPGTKPTFLLTHLTRLWLPLHIHEYVEHVYNAMDSNHYNVVNTIMVRCHELKIVMCIPVFKWHFQEEVLIELFAVSY